MPKSTATCNSLLALLFNATAWADLAQNDGSSPNTDLYLSLHTASPGVGNNQTTNETAYTNYARIAVARTTGGWDAPASAATANAALAQFAQCGVTGATITHVAIGTASSGAGTVLYAGALNSSLAVANLIQPQFAAGALTVTEA
ncbi:hypothetical protein UFOVP591_4 [uncultured Caudovirales phage]|uniref:Uncharacterized protein n=1 Tax=uncultured Caudovirales phage TaxID=2100421 RepID=A0A6J5N630_9CAUD|nr:hypothetical protein UFOVP591_4 [uncultured Caudovirales phage]